MKNKWKIEMILKNSSFFKFADYVKEKNKKIVVYGAGMIGQIIVPYYIQKYKLEDRLLCYFDMDKKKRVNKISIGKQEYSIADPQLLQSIDTNVVLLITNSKFYSVLDYLEKIENIGTVEAWIVPLMKLEELYQNEVEVVVPPISCDRMLIPKTIHYCWFGGKELPTFLKECIDSWKKFCPDYEIKEWNENNYDVSKILFMKEAFEQKKYGFVTDVARLDILYNYGGIYMDTDVKLLKPIDSLLCQSAFTGIEKWGNINSGGMFGAVAKHPMVKELLDYRAKFHFVEPDGSLNIETNGIYETIPFIRHGYKIENIIQQINGMTVYPSDFFHPYDYLSCKEEITDNTYSKHYFYGGWMDYSDKDNRAKTQERYEEVLKRVIRI